MSTNRPTRLFRAALPAAALTLLGACADAPLAPTAPATLPALSRAGAVAGGTEGLLACPSATTESATAVIGRAGGVVRAAGSELRVTAGAVDRPTAFTLVVPASPVMEIEVHAEGAAHYAFRHPVMVTIDYSRCAASALPTGSLAAWYIDSASHTQLGTVVGVVDDRRDRRITFRTDHLSGYAAAYRSLIRDELGM